MSGARRTDTVQRELPVALGRDIELPIDLRDERLDTPAVVVDLDVVDANITRFANFSRMGWLMASSSRMPPAAVSLIRPSRLPKSPK